MRWQRDCMNTCDPMYKQPFPVEIFEKFDLLERAMFFYWGVK